MYYSNLPQDELNRLLQKVIKNIFDHLSIFATDAQGNFVFTSGSFSRDLRLTPEEVLNSSVQEMIRRNVYTKSATVMSLKSKKNQKTATFIRSGEYHIGESTLLRNQEGEIQYVLTEGMNIPNTFSLIDLMMDSDEQSQEVNHIRKRLYGMPPQMVYQSAVMDEVVKKATRIALVDSNALITGESGVGKDLLASYIHNKSERHDKRFIPVCIPLIQPSLMESELFGYVGGAFTHAKKEGKMGLFEMANGGTVFLDEIGDIPLDMQVKLLRVLENREVFRVGGVDPIKLDLRVIAATNKNLQQMVRDGKFREDLLYRLNVIDIKIPPLRERPDDIGLLVKHFTDSINAKYEFNKSISDGAIELLTQYHWPGNIRELRNLTEKLIILSEEDVMDAKYVDSILFDDLSKTIPHTSRGEASQITLAGSISEEYTAEERKRILSALVQCNGNKSKAARLLNISRATFYKKLKEFE